MVFTKTRAHPRRGIAESYLKLLAVWNGRSIAFRTVCRTAPLLIGCPPFAHLPGILRIFQLKISVILPLNDRQGTGWKSLESALAQDAPRSSYEIIAIVGGRSEQEAMSDPNARGLLERCDAVVRFHEDLDIVENRMGPCEAGVAASSGEVLYFAEGHTILHPQCCRLIAAHFAANPSSQIVRGDYYDIPRNELSRLINLFKASRKRKGLESLPMISLGGQTAMKRELFGIFDHVSSRSGMFAEVDISIFVERNKIEVGKIGRPLCDHISDRTLEWLIGWVLKTGRTHFDHFNASSAYANVLSRWKRAIFSLANRGWCAVMLFPLSYAAGVLLLRAARPLLQLSEPLALHFYLLGYRLIVVAGFCKARILSLRMPRGSRANLSETS